MLGLTDSGRGKRRVVGLDDDVEIPWGWDTRPVRCLDTAQGEQRWPVEIVSSHGVHVSKTAPCPVPQLHAQLHAR